MNVRSLLFLFSLLFSFKSIGTTYYVAPTGQATNDGKSFVKAKDLLSAIPLAKAGDSIILQGGSYNIAYTSGVANTIKINQSGQSGNPIYMGTSNNAKALLDFSFPEHQWVQDSYGFDVIGSYWYFKGITITNAGYQGAYVKGAYNTFENCVFSYCRFSGIEINKGGSYTTLINCDAYRNYNPKPTSSPAGGAADGFAPKQTMGPGNVLLGCRAWENSDDGFDTFGDVNTPNVFVIMENCWAFNNGSLKIGSITYAGNKDGFKLGGNNVPQQNQAYNCIAFGNGFRGFDENKNKGSVKLYNCLAYNNNVNYAFTGALNSGEQHDFRNNISLKETSPSNILSSHKQLSNTWNNGFSVSAADFKSLDVSLATIERNPDGSIPETDLFRLAPSSSLIDAGTTTARPYKGSKPDIGPFEYEGITTGFSYHLNFSHNTVVFPTIVENEVHVRFLASFNDATVDIYSTEGALVYHGRLENNETTISCTNLNVGKYVVKVTSEGISSSFRMIKK